jgi:hypothetical protein
MSHSSRYLRAAALGAGVAIGVFSAAVTGADAAQKKPAEAAQPQTEASQKQQAAAAAAAKNNYESGVKQYQAGKYGPAVDNLSAALRGGGLASGDMARALYIRGLAYKKQSKPGLAISDLTSALWLKNGLNDSDRANATAERAEAYRQAGLGDGNTGGESVAVADPNAGASAAPAPAVSAAPAAIAETKPSKKKGKKDEVAAAPPIPAPEPVAEITRQPPDSEAAQDAARARKLAATPVDAGGLTSVASQTLTGNPAAAPLPPAAPVAPAAVETTAGAVTPAATPPPVAATAAPVTTPMAAPAADTPVLSAAPVDQAPAAAEPATGSSPIGKFFSNLFSGSSTAQPAPAGEQVTTASTTPPAATSSWNDQTSVANGAASSGAAAKGVKQAAAAAAPAEPSVKGGKYKIHIAAVRSRQEAEAIAQKVQAENSAALKSRTASVDEAVIGSMGTFYRVRVGSFATADEPRGVCNALRSSGFDCLVVTN